MRTTHQARPHYPSYTVSRVTATCPVAELVLCAVLVSLILWVAA